MCVCVGGDISPLSVMRKSHPIAKGQLPGEKYANLLNPSFVDMEDSRMKTQTNMLGAPFRFRYSDGCTDVSANSTPEALSTQERPSMQEARGCVCSPME